MKLLFGATLLCLVTWTAPRLPAADEILIADFEGPDYAAWKSTGQAFGPAPARGTLPGQMHVDGFRGQGLVNSYFQGDGTTGTLTSPEFVIERKYIAFLIGGGKDPEKLALRLLVDGQPVRSATGPNDRPGGSELLAPDSWDVSELLGKSAVIQIVDQATGGWGHINVDHLVQTDRKPPGLRNLATSSHTVVKTPARYILTSVQSASHSPLASFTRSMVTSPRSSPSSPRRRWM